MTIDELVVELATTHHSTVLLCVENIRSRNILYFTSDLREKLSLYGATVKSYSESQLVITKPTRSTVRVRIVSTDQLANDPWVLKGYHPDTPIFTASRTGYYRSTVASP